MSTDKTIGKVGARVERTRLRAVAPGETANV